MGDVTFVPFGDSGAAQVLLARTQSGLSVKLDTCYSCNGAPQAHYLSDGNGSIICQNCGTTLDLDELDSDQGGCRPLDIAHTIEGDRVAIAADDLQAAEPLFAAIER